MNAPRTRVHYVGGSRPYQAVYFDGEARVWFDIGDAKATVEEAKANEREFLARNSRGTTDFTEEA